MTSNEHTLIITYDYYLTTQIPTILGLANDSQRRFTKEHNILKTSVSGEAYKLHFKNEESMVKYAMTML